MQLVFDFWKSQVGVKKDVKRQWGSEVQKNVTRQDMDKDNNLHGKQRKVLEKIMESFQISQEIIFEGSFIYYGS